MFQFKYSIIRAILDPTRKSPPLLAVGVVGWSGFGLMVDNFVKQPCHSLVDVTGRYLTRNPNCTKVYANLSGT